MVVGKEVAMTSGRQREEEVDVADNVQHVSELIGTAGFCICVLLGFFSVTTFLVKSGNSEMVKECLGIM